MNFLFMVCCKSNDLSLLVNARPAQESFSPVARGTLQGQSEGDSRTAVNLADGSCRFFLWGLIVEPGCWLRFPTNMSLLPRSGRPQAFAWFEKVYSEHSTVLTGLKVNPLYDPLRSGPILRN